LIAAAPRARQLRREQLLEAPGRGGEELQRRGHRRLLARPARPRARPPRAFPCTILASAPRPRHDHRPITRPWYPICRGNDARTPAQHRLERLTHAYGSAADVPGLLRALAADDRQARKDAYWELYGNIFHQGTRYPATAPAVPFLLELLADPHTPDRHELLLLLTHLVTGQFSVAADPVMYAGEQDDGPALAATTTPRSSATSTAPPSSASRST
jgi:hypothetical protein